MSPPRPISALVASPAAARGDALPPPWPLRLPWPLPALLAWVLGWLVWGAATAAGAPPLVSLPAGCAASLLLAWRFDGLWRRLIGGAGFPASALALGLGAGADVPPWAWLAALLPLLLAYPLRAWRDAPFFPTTRGALDGLDRVVPAPRRVLDAGCGVGHGLAELRRLWPQAELRGVEWSAALAAIARARLRATGVAADVGRADMWRHDWRGYDLVYLFQRPESMRRAWDKACREMAPGAWLVSLEFAVPDLAPHWHLAVAGRRPVWIYRVGAPGAGSTASPAGR